jgi:S1-C subfamily serine protease
VSQLITWFGDLISRLLMARGRLAATIAGRDPGSDLLVLRLTDAALVPASRASAPARVGQLALAVGRPARDGVQSSWGIITSINGPARTGRGGLLEKYLLSETTPYPGFSGGPLVDVEGGLLGLNTSGLTPGSALTIPVDVAWPIGEALAREGSVKRGYLGIRTQSVQVPGDENLEGLLVIWQPGGPADSAGILVGDIDGHRERRVESPDDIFVALSGETVGKPVEPNLSAG